MFASLVSWGLFISSCLIFSASSQAVPTICPPNEIPVQCTDRCQTCEYRKGGCVQAAVCTPGCNCLQGYFRNKQGQCVAEIFCDDVIVTPAAGECDLITVGNGYYNCTTGPDGCTRCDITCDGKYQGRFTCCPGKGWTTPLPYCVKPATSTTTPNTVCPPNEIPVPCIDRCQRCEYRKGGCVQILVCTPGCNCLQGYFRNRQGQCVPEIFCDDVIVTPAAGECELVTVGNGFYNCTTGPDGCTRCDITCDGKYQGRFTCCPGKGWSTPLPYCVKPKPSSTTPNTVCPPNEIPVPCIDRCQRCEYRYGGCVQAAVCTPGCNCLQGYFRNKQEQCIPGIYC